MLRVWLGAVMLMALAPLHALAQTFPALYRVQGVAADDVLNVRVQPTGSAPILGQLDASQTNIEVIAVNDTGTWGLVNLDEGSGWASMAFLAPQTQPDGVAQSRKLTCGGTEPFWSVVLTPGIAAVYQTPDSRQSFQPIGGLQPASGRFDPWLVTLDAGTHAIIRRAACSDGMSDRSFGLEINLVLNGGTLLNGCCSIAP